jgi:hypothetical protein
METLVCFSFYRILQFLSLGPLNTIIPFLSKKTRSSGMFIVFFMYRSLVVVYVEMNQAPPAAPSHEKACWSTVYSLGTVHRSHHKNGLSTVD